MGLLDFFRVMTAVGQIKLFRIAKDKNWKTDLLFSLEDFAYPQNCSSAGKEMFDVFPEVLKK